VQRDKPQGEGDRGALVARLSVTLGTIGLLAAGAGPIAVHAGIALPLQGFTVFLSGLLLGLVGFLTGTIALLRTRGTRGLPRSRAWTGTGLGLLLVIVLLVAASPGRGLPRINDITTDPDNPPGFAAAAREPANQGRDLSYPASFAAQQRKAYPDIKPIVLAQAPAEAFVRAQRAAGQLGWKTTYSDPAAGMFEAQEVSPTFLFVDDIVVRVQPADEGSRIDVRSKSRNGTGDLGVNAKRIRAFAQTVVEGK
jgi:uncharacterized protein (DUF1499 family)